MPDMLDSAWLEIKTKTQKVGPTVDACSNPYPETAFNVMVKRRRAEMNVSTLSAEQKRVLEQAKDNELNTFVKYSVVEAAPRQEISPSALIKMRWVVTRKGDGQLKAWLVVQGFADQWHCKIRTSSSTVFRRSRQIFLTLVASFGFQKETCSVRFFNLTWTNNMWTTLTTRRIFKSESAQSVSDTFCESVPELC